MKHHLKISVSKHPQTGGIVRLKNVSLRERFLSLLLGEKQKLMILIPGDSVDSLSINETEEAEYGQDQFAAECGV